MSSPGLNIYAAAAAVELHKGPSALSYIVQKMEADLGVTVFDRTGHRARLTETGEVLLARGRQVLKDVRDLECRALRIDHGWESKLRIAVDTMVPFAALVPYMTAFYGESSVTRLQCTEEVLGGSWDALYTRRADLVIGAMGEAPFAGTESREIGTLAMAFCVAPGHPLAGCTEPLDARQVSQYRAIVIADSSRKLEPRTMGLIEGQDTVTVPNLDAQLMLHLAGLGVGCLPACVAQPYLDSVQLVMKELSTANPDRSFHLAWHAEDMGEGLKWWIRNLDRPGLLAEMWKTARS